MSSNTTASIRARLLNKAKAQGVPFDEVLRQYGIERMLFRLTKSEYSDRFILKGAQLLRIWAVSSFRSTMDMDLLGRIDNDLSRLKNVFRQLCGLEVEPEDGLRFDADSVDAQRIKEDADYHGVRLTLAAYLGSARIPMQVDIGFDDIVMPGPREVAFPSLLDLPEPILQGYTPESVFAEKLEAMVKLGEQNSRMKDFYDLRFLILNDLVPDQKQLLLAIKETFGRRKTAVPDSLPLLLAKTHPALAQKQTQWHAFVAKKQLKDVPAGFTEVTDSLRTFIEPLIARLNA